MLFGCLGCRLQPLFFLFSLFSQFLYVKFFLIGDNMRKFIFSFVFFSFFCFIFAQDVDQAVGQTDYYPLVMDYVSNAFVLNGLDGTGLTAG